MKICIFSDIHGNLLAFEAAYRLILKESADINLFLGDLCGYYFDEIAVWDRLLTIPRLVALRGNHDDMFLRAADRNISIQEQYRAEYGPAMDLFLEKDHKAVTAWLRSLHFTWEGQEAVCGAYHGSPWDALEEYIYPDTSLERFRNLQYPWVFIGHTHYSMDRIEGAVRVINPGSLGQPRDGYWPRFVVVDLSNGDVDFKEVRYDREMFIREIRRKAPRNPYLYKVIERIN